MGFFSFPSRAAVEVFAQQMFTDGSPEAPRLKVKPFAAWDRAERISGLLEPGESRWRLFRFVLAGLSGLVGVFDQNLRLSKGKAPWLST